VKIFNTLTNQKETFVPLNPDRVGIYVCGVTVYDECHLGHARSAIVFDMIQRYLRYRGYQVNYVKNFTDVDDKILKRAGEESLPWQQITEKYVQAYHRDMKRLEVINPDIEPKATEHMAEIIQMIQTLLDKKHAYRVDHDVFFDVSTFPQYGRLGRRKLEDMQAGARVEVDARKRDPMDFALWKGAKPEEPAWDSPWGPGRPGWHIECSAMSVHHLGTVFDIHGGGKDLIFPHHENEMAQSCAATGREFSRYWVHNGFVTIDKEKMSKSLGNFFTVREIFDQSNCPEPVTAETLRYFLLTTHYRSDVNFSNQAVSEAKAALDNLYGLFQRLQERSTDESNEEKTFVSQRLDQFVKTFEESMDDDLNTPKALAGFQHLRTDINQVLATGLSHESGKRIRETFRRCGEPLGLFLLSEHEWVFHPLVFGKTSEPKQDERKGLTDEWIQEQIQQRAKARNQKNFAEADRIRQDLATQGIILEDRPDGTTRWKR